MRFAARSNARAPSAVALALGVSLCAWAPDANAYCRTSVCGEQAAVVCEPPGGSDCGTPLYWRHGCFGFSMQEDGSAQVPFATAEALMEQAFATWAAVDCGGGSPDISVQNIGPVSCAEAEYNQEDGNANVVIFRDGDWPYAGQGNTLALTTVTFNLDNGEIFDADLEVNASSEVDLTVGDVGVQYDLASILTHEAGHMLGIAHSPVVGATMTIQYVPGDLDLRSLHPDDAAAICATYPPVEEPPGCDPTPRHGFKTTCGVPPTEEDCSCRSAPAPDSRGWPLGLAALFASACARRRARLPLRP
jgi:MYXO-CTERM domain-containing protein